MEVNCNTIEPFICVFITYAISLVMIKNMLVVPGVLLVLIYM